MNIDEVTQWLTSTELKPDDIQKLPKLVLAATAHEIGHQNLAPVPNLKLVEKDDDCLMPEDVARILKTTIKWVYAHKRQLPYISLTKRNLKFSRKGLQRWLAARINKSA